MSIAVAALMLMATGAALVSAQTPDAPGPPFGNVPEIGFSPGEQMDKNQIEERVNNMTQIAEERKLFGMFTYDDGAAEGHFVEFSHNETTGQLSNYSVRTGEEYTDVFRTVYMEDFAPDDMRVAGSVFAQWNNSDRMMVHNNPTSAIKVSSENTANVSFMLADGIEADEMENGDRQAVHLTGGNVSSMIVVGNGSITLDNVTDDVYVNVTADDGELFFRTMPYFADADTAEMISDAISDGKISNEMAVLSRDGDAVSVENSYVRGYGMEMSEVRDDGMELDLSSDKPDGKVMIVTFDDETLDASQELSVTLNDQVVNEGELSDVLAATGTESGDGMYALIEEDGTYHLAVYVPHFSTQTLSVESVEAAVDEICSSVCAMAVLALLALPLILMRRRR